MDKLSENDFLYFLDYIRNNIMSESCTYTCSSDEETDSDFSYSEDHTHKYEKNDLWYMITKALDTEYKKYFNDYKYDIEPIVTNSDVMLSNVYVVKH